MYIDISPKKVCVGVCSVTSVMWDSLHPHGLQPTSFLYPWNSPGKDIAMECPPPGDLPKSGSEPGSPALHSFPTEPPGKPTQIHHIRPDQSLSRVQLSVTP